MTEQNFAAPSDKPASTRSDGNDGATLSTYATSLFSPSTSGPGLESPSTFDNPSSPYDRSSVFNPFSTVGERGSGST
ncbi:MAG: hypothetical protein SGJ27_17975 [Candidatus Melainabacteria bacterium]|nr:hypothetical protein [Candidatus Melainabacteria bacterium]